MVGTGGRLPWLKTLDARLSEPAVDLNEVGERDLWLNTGELRRAVAASQESNVTFSTRVDDVELSRLYGSALCVVAPAFLEDYGLTAIEAMMHRKPVIVCRDGGGLTEFIEDGVQGFVVEPTGRAIAERIQFLSENPDSAEAMGRAGWELANEFSWQRATDQVLDGLSRVMG
jgi:glycosyltransferase involved in cell wall biosynthesis